MPIDFDHIDRTLRDFKYVLNKTHQQLQDLKQQISLTMTEIRQFLTYLRFFKRVMNENQSQFTQIKSQDSLSFGDSTLPLTQTCKKCNQKFLTFNQLFDHNQVFHERCSHCNQFYLEAKPYHQNFLCGSVNQYCDVCFTFVQRKQIDSHVKICSFRKCHKCHLNIYVKGFEYHLKVCDKENFWNEMENRLKSRNQNEKNDKKKKKSKKAERKESEDLSMLPCSLWVR